MSHLKSSGFFINKIFLQSCLPFNLDKMINTISHDNNSFAWNATGPIETEDEFNRSSVVKASIYANKILYCFRKKNLINDYTNHSHNYRKILGLIAYKKDFLIVDAGMNDLLRPSLYDAFHKIEEVNKNNGARKKYNVVGPICETGDVLGKDVELPPLVKNDLLIIHSVGAYGYVMSSNYNTRPKAPEVLIEDKKIKLIRKKETITQIMENEFTNE